MCYNYDYMNLIDKLNWRYATKSFDTNKKLSDEQVENLIEAFRLAPSSYGLQPWKLIMVSNPETRDKLKAASWNQGQITEASHLFVLCAQNKMDAQYVEEYVKEVGVARSMTDLSPMDGYKSMMIGSVNTHPDQASWNAKQVYLALGIMMSACAGMDIDSCAMEGFDASKYSEILGLAEMGLTPCVVLPVGYRSESDDMSTVAKVRKSKEQIFLEIE
jgi:nitroreductase / dihydropteridine reductase